MKEVGARLTALAQQLLRNCVGHVMALLDRLDDLQTCTLVSYRPAPQGPGLLMSPSHGLGQSADCRGRLVAREIGGRQLVPPVAANPRARAGVQRPGGIPLGRVDEAQRHLLSDDVNGHFQVTVIAYDDSSVHGAAEDVDEHVTCDIDVAALLFAPRDGGHERRKGDVGPLGVSNHEGPVRLSENGSAAAICGRGSTRR